MNVLVVLTTRTGHRVVRPEWVRRWTRRHLELSDGTTWPLPAPGATGVYPSDGPVHLEIEP